MNVMRSSPESGYAVTEVEEQGGRGENLLYENYAVSRDILTPRRVQYLTAGSAVLLLITFFMSVAALAKIDKTRYAFDEFHDGEFHDLKHSGSGDAAAWGSSGCWFVDYNPGLTDYTTGDSTMGDPLIEFGGHHYQIAGGEWASLSWHDALYMSQWRCHNGVPGHLATIESDAENAFLLNALKTNSGFRDHDSAWIGLTDMVNEGTFRWIGTGVPITTSKGDVPGEYSNWNSGNPDSNGEEDCVVMYSDGYWNDDSCYKKHQFFFVEYDDP